MNGMKHDGGKPRTDLIPVAPLLSTAEVLGHGAVKYDAHNWRAGIDFSRVYGALLRHLYAYWDGEEIDPESGLHHLAHAQCELMFLHEFALKPEHYANFDDRFKQAKPTPTTLADITTKTYAAVEPAVPDEDHSIAVNAEDTTEKPKTGMFGGFGSNKKEKDEALAT